MAGKASSPGFHETAIGKEIAAIRARAKAEAKTKSKRAEGLKVERWPWTKAEQRSLTKAWLETTPSAEPSNCSLLKQPLRPCSGQHPVLLFAIPFSIVRS
jgi:hypothetical protein